MGPIFVILLFLSFCIFIGYTMYRKVQASLLELMIILAICSLCAGEMARLFAQIREDSITAVLLGLLCSMPLFYGATWGLSWSNALHVEGTGKRVALLVLGSLFPLGAALVSLSFMFGDSVAHNQSIPLRLVLAVAVGWVIFGLGIYVQYLSE